MANYTDQEVQDAVSKIVLSTVSHPTGILGNRSISKTFNDLQEAAAGVYVLYFNAPFYTIKLGTTRIADLVDSQAQTITQLIDAVQATSKLVTPIQDISPLANANAALQALGSAVSTRKQGFQDIQQVPAFRSYAQNINQFIQQVGGNIKGTTSDPSILAQAQVDSSVSTLAVTDTPAGARAQIPGLITQMQNQHQELIRRVNLLAAAMDDFGAMNLPQVAAQGVISRASDVLAQHCSAMASQDENTRLENLRAVVLDLLTQQPIVEKYGAALAPSEFITTKGFATAYSDSTHPSTPASIVSTIAGPYPIEQQNHLLQFTMDGGIPFDYPLPLGHIAELPGHLVEPYVITGDNNALRIVFDNPDVPSPATFDIALTSPLIQTAAEIATTINAVLAGTDLICETLFSPLKFDSIMTVDTLGGNNARFFVVAGSIAGLGITVGDALDVLDGPDAGTTWTIFAVDPGGLFVDASGVAPVTPVLFPADISVKVGPADRVLNLRDTNPTTSLAMRRVIRFPITNGAQDQGAATLGWVPGIESRSRPVAAKDLAANITSSIATASAKELFSPVYYIGQAHADLLDGSKVVLSILEAEGTITGGTVVTFTPSDPTLDLSDIAVGDRFVLRSTLATSELNAEGSVTSTGATIGITFAFSITAGAVGIEVGPNVSFVFGSILNIATGNNQGRYVVRESQGVGTTCSFELLLESGLPVPKNGALADVFEVSFGRDYLQFNSLLTRTTSSVQLNNGATGIGAEYFFPALALPAHDIGSTPYLKFGTFPAGAELGDFILLYETDYSQVSRQFTIMGVDQAFSVLKIANEIESSANINFNPNVVAPFGKIRVAQVADFASLKANLIAWLQAAEQQTQFFRNLARVLNPVLLNTRPTTAEVNTAANELRMLLAKLTKNGATFYGSLSSPVVVPANTLEFALSNYSSPVEPSVDALLVSFRDKGSDRAIDLLLEGQFAEFFGLDVTGTSYSGALMQKASALAMNDLPIRKSNRTNVTGQTTIGTIPNQPDFEYNSDDADSPNTPDIPVGADVPSPGANF